MEHDDAARRAAVFELTRQALGALTEGRITVSDRTRSMAPLLRGGEILAWRRPADAPRRADLLLYFDGTLPVVHRVLARRGDGFVTKGDNRPAADVVPVRPADVLGVVAAVEAAGVVRPLTGPGPRAYARAACAWSRAGGWLHHLASCGDAALRRVPGWGDRRLVRAPAWWIQAAGQRLLHAALFRLCHPRR